MKIWDSVYEWWQRWLLKKPFRGAPWFGGLYYISAQEVCSLNPAVSFLFFSRARRFSPKRWTLRGGFVGERHVHKKDKPYLRWDTAKKYKFGLLYVHLRKTTFSLSLYLASHQGSTPTLTDCVIYPLCFLTTYKMTPRPSVLAGTSDPKHPDPYYSLV